MDATLLFSLPLWFAIFLFSTTCHEAAHALVAKWGGDRTAHAAGQVTLDPTPHVRRSPLGMVVVPIVSFVLNQGTWMLGWASAPYDPRWAATYPKRAGWMALAGPGANLALVLGAGLAIYVGLWAGVFEAPTRVTVDHIVRLADGGEGLASQALSIVFSLNLILFTFNLIPLPPLDGSAALALVLPEELFRKFHALMNEPGLSMVGLLVAITLFGRVFAYVFNLALALLYPGVFSVF